MMPSLLASQPVTLEYSKVSGQKLHSAVFSNTNASIIHRFDGESGINDAILLSSSGVVSTSRQGRDPKVN